MSRTVANIYRRADAHRIIPLPLSQSELEARSKAEAASKALLNHCLRSNSIPADNPPRTLSFAELLSLDLSMTTIAARLEIGRGTAHKMLDKLKAKYGAQAE